ncbi:hypothetical protein J18TS1_12390 [Oceanobacillus oncorhynchi subsp. incaldanensis]|uniref:hypothetical protein n=1 Tax=Oceanobacillus oncorhynchi TaxID=545501 RepID=UPI001B0CF69C|nr:hypothetical protein [Oceanobacillus oncorhynchi]GIO18139.1 hypothetical protein J18TS1_12390 [Oceanobacillus oncorhynchi subsp. incaldanensis]
MMKHLWEITCAVNRNKKEIFKVVTTYKDIDLLAIVIKRYFSDVGNSLEDVQEIKYLGTVYE